MMSNKESLRFIKQTINAMYDWVRVLDRDDNIIFVNKAMSESLKYNAIGEKCYKLIGRDTPCENCISRKAVFHGDSQEKEEMINGKLFSVMSSPIRNEKGEITAVVEVLRDITQMKKLQNKIIEQNKKLQDDLAIARKLQCSLLPKIQSDEKFKFSFVYKPCEDLGGDFVDIFKIDSNHVGIYIADVSGHGVPASILTVFLRSSINKKVLSPSEALKSIYNEYNKNEFNHDLYITVFYAIIDLYNYTVTFSNAGHNVVPIIYNGNRLEFLKSSGVPISDWIEDPGYEDKTLPLFSGDKLFFYTDGIAEIRNTNNEQFGEERLFNILLNGDSDPSGVLNRVIEKACEFAGIKDSSEILDDITMALLKIE